MKNILINDSYRKGSKSKSKINLNDIQSIISKGLSIKNQKNLDFINGVTTIDKPFSNRIIFIEKISECTKKRLNRIKSRSLFVVLPNSFLGKIKHPYLKVANPREIFSKIVSRLFHYERDFWLIEDEIIASDKLGEGTIIMNNVFIGKNSILGKNCTVHPNVYIGPNTIIGNNVVIRPNTSLGHSGFGHIRSKRGKNKNLPHVGGLIIGNNVEIGATNTIAAGTIHPTVIEDNVATDDHVHIAHNCYVSKGTQFTAGAILGGSVTVGKNVFVGLNSTIKDGLSIGDEAFIGSSSNILKDVPCKALMIGNPARVK